MKNAKACDRIFVTVSVSVLVAATLRADDLYIWAQETLSGVTFFYSGSVDTTGFPGSGKEKTAKGQGAAGPATGDLRFGNGPAIDPYDGILPDTGRSFGMGSVLLVSTFAGDALWLHAMPSQRLGLPAGYVGGEQIAGSIEFDGETFASIGVDPTPFTFNTLLGDNTIHMFTNPNPTLDPEIPPTLNSAFLASLQSKIKKLLKKTKKLKKKGKKAKAKKLLKKVKKLKKQLAALG